VSCTGVGLIGEGRSLNCVADLVRATFRIFGENFDPDAVSDWLGLAPTKIHRNGDPKPGAARWEERYGEAPTPYREGAWLLSTEDYLDADARKPIDELLELLEPRRDEFQRLIESGCFLDIFVFWPNHVGHGGPSLDASQMLRMGALGISISWDIYESDEARDF